MRLVDIQSPDAKGFAFHAPGGLSGEVAPADNVLAIAMGVRNRIDEGRGR
jgi:hypothetical protein